MLELVPDAAAAWSAVRAGIPAAGHDAADDPVVQRWIEQFGADVAGIDAAERAAVAAVAGDGLFDLVLTTWATDMAARVDAALEQLTGDEPAWPHADPSPLWPAIDAFLPVVARLDALDPVTTELVRLRGARANACRLCCSRRSVDAVAAGADESTFDAVDRYEASDLPEGQKVALRLVDAMLWTPAAWPAGLAEDVRRLHRRAAVVELVLDVARNGANRIAVAMGADAAAVTEGVEWFATLADGSLAYGLPDPTS